MLPRLISFLGQVRWPYCLWYVIQLHACQVVWARNKTSLHCSASHSILFCPFLRAHACIIIAKFNVFGKPSLYGRREARWLRFLNLLLQILDRQRCRASNSLRGPWRVGPTSSRSRSARPLRPWPQIVALPAPLAFRARLAYVLNCFHQKRFCHSLIY